MTLSPYGKREWITVLVIGVIVTAAIPIAWPAGWWLSILTGLFTLALLAFFRDPTRIVPSQRDIMVSPADGTISSVHEVEHYEPFGEGAACVRIFLSLFNVHINRSSCHGRVKSITHKPGKYMNALKPESAEVNESNTLVFVHPVRGHEICAVRQVSGAIARTIVCGAEEGQILQRGERFGLIKFGSTTELYVPLSAKPNVLVQRGQKVKGGETVLMEIKGAPGTSRDVDADAISGAMQGASMSPSEKADESPDDGDEAASREKSDAAVTS